jgi:hypothetical protein
MRLACKAGWLTSYSIACTIFGGFSRSEKQSFVLAFEHLLEGAVRISVVQRSLFHENQSLERDPLESGCRDSALL